MAYTYDGGPRKPPLLQTGLWAVVGAVVGTVGGGVLGYILVKAQFGGAEACEKKLRVCVGPVTAATEVGIPVGVFLGFVVGFFIGGLVQGMLKRRQHQRR